VHLGQTYWCSEIGLTASPNPPPDEGLREATDALVVSSLVSFVYVRLGSLAFESMRKCRSRTRALFGELLSQLLKIGRSVVQDR